MKRAFVVLCIATALLVLWILNSDSNEDVGLQETILHNGISRDYIVYVPENLPVNAPLVVVAHGYTSSAQTMMSYSGMNAVADTEKFLVVYPQGTKDQRNNNFFNVGYDFHASSKVDDLGFIKALVTKLIEEYKLNSNHVFATGMSNGGDLSFYLACFASDMFQAVAPIAGSMMQTTVEACSPKRPLPIFEVHGDADDVTLFKGDMANKDQWGPYPDIPFVMDFWVDMNALELSEITNLPGVPEGENSVSFQRYWSENSDREVWFYVIDEGGHDWPVNEINTSQEIWKFFKKYIN